MKHQISNEDVRIYKPVVLGLFIAFLILYVLVLGIFIALNKLSNDIQQVQELRLVRGVAIVAIPFMYYIIIGKFYTVSIDDEWIYFKRLKKGQIEISRLIKVSDGLLPRSIFFQQVYIIKLTFLMPNGKKKKISFLSKKIKYFQSIFEVDVYRNLRKIAENNRKQEHN